MIERTFVLEQMPKNLRAEASILRSRFVGWCPPIGRRLARAAFKYLNDEGTFIYTRQSRQYRLKFPGRNRQFHAIYDPAYRHGYELETASLLVELTRGSRDFMDIGANWGCMSFIVAAQPSFSGKIHAFEPNPAVARDLRRFVQECQMENMMTVHACALGDGTERRQLVLGDANDTGLGSIGALSESIDAVPVRRMDDLNLRPGVIKMDVEGFEVSVLKGGAATISEFMPAIVFESVVDYLHPRNTVAPFELLGNLGYSFFLPLLQYRIDDRLLLASYGAPLAELSDSDATPTLVLHPIDGRFRFPFFVRANILAVHNSRVAEINHWVARE